MLFLATIMFPHELKIHTFNNLLSLRKMFWIASCSLAVLTLKHRLERLYMHTGPLPVKAVRRDPGCHNDSFIKGPHLIISKSGHIDAQEMCLLYSNSMRSDLSHTSNHKLPLRSPWCFAHVNGISVFSAQSKAISTHLVCQSWSNKSVYTLNTMGSFDIPDRHRHRQVITPIAPFY